MKRRFSRLDRARLFIETEGRCAECGVELPREWHADHIIPFSGGGPTLLSNGQALCPDCNLSKGNHMFRTPDNFKVRDWQQEAYERLERALTRGKRDFLTVATPGAGKTKFALWTIQKLLQSGYRRVFIIVPSRKLKEQWTKEATPFGIDLEYNLRTGQGWPRGFHGIVVTYSQVSMMPLYFQNLAQSNSIVVLDELHHCGEDKSWGDSIQSAFENTGCRLALSGTPFRSDSAPIPFVTYVKGRSKADYTYSYQQSLYDNVCRMVYFPRVGGEAEWFTDGEIMRRALSADLEEDQQSDVLKAVLDFRGKWNLQVFRQAHEKLTALRLVEHKTAKGLVLAEDMTAADRWRNLIQQETGRTPVVVVHDEELTNGTIKEFSDAGQDGAYWIIAVRMVSEGVDIPDLRIAVFASRIQSELFFRQAVGRVVRILPHLKKNQPAFFYIPEIPSLIKFAHEIKEERDHALRDLQREQQRELQEEWEQTEGEWVPRNREFVVLDSAAEMRGVIADGETIGQEEIDEAKWTMAALQSQGAFYTPEEIARIVRTHQSSTPAVPIATHTDLGKEKENLREKRAEKLKQYAPIIAQRMGIEYATNKKQIMLGINSYLKQRYQNETPETLTVDELREQIELVPSLASDPPPKLRESIRWAMRHG